MRTLAVCIGATIFLLGGVAAAKPHGLRKSPYSGWICYAGYSFSPLPDEIAPGQQTLAQGVEGIMVVKITQWLVAKFGAKVPACTNGLLAGEFSIEIARAMRGRGDQRTMLPTKLTIKLRRYRDGSDQIAERKIANSLAAIPRLLSAALEEAVRQAARRAVKER